MQSICLDSTLEYRSTLYGAWKGSKMLGVIGIRGCGETIWKMAQIYLDRNTVVMSTTEACFASVATLAFEVFVA